MHGDRHLKRVTYPQRPSHPPPAWMASAVDSVSSVGTPIVAPPAPDWDNNTFVIASVRRRGSHLQFESERLSGDIDVVTVAERQDPDSVRFASYRMIEFLLDKALEKENKECAMFLANLLPDTPRDSRGGDTS